MSSRVSTMSQWLRRKTTMTIQAQVPVQSQVPVQTPVSVQAQVYKFIPRNYQVLGGLDVDKNSIAVTFCNHEGLLPALRLPYSAAQLLNYERKHFGEQRVAPGYLEDASGHRI